jgi:hypothetical protein
MEGSREVQREVEHYNLQAIIAVGFKIENERAVQFRKWANVQDNCTYAYAVQIYGQSTVNDRGIGTVLISNLTNPPRNTAVLQISEP